LISSKEGLGTRFWARTRRHNKSRIRDEQAAWWKRDLEFMAIRR